jgi:hypothetical protein
MSQLLKYLIIILVCLGLGAIVGILIYNHLSPTELVKSSLQTVSKAENLVKDPSKATAADSAKKDGNEPKQEKKTAHKEEPAHTTENSKSQTTKSGEPKNDPKEDVKNKDESTEYLRSLWPIKKRKATEVSGEQEGPLYFEGTNPYGPPPTYKEELFAETKALRLRGDPPVRIPPPLNTLPKEKPAPQQQPSLPPATLYQVEVGQFSVLSKAQEARDILRSKGHEVDVYYTGPITNPDWFYVRLSSLFSKPQAYQKAQTIAILEKIVPNIVAVTRDVKKLR